MEKSVEIFVLLNFLVIGASHFFQSDAWVDFFKWVRDKGRIGIFVYSFLSLSMGSIIVCFHWVWEGVIPTTITCLGIAQFIKGAIGFVLPEYGLKNLQKPMAQNPNYAKWVGVLIFVLSIIGLFFIGDFRPF
jgi:hypothetical protein